MNVLYFAWVRERIGIPRETVETEAHTVQDLVEELRARGWGGRSGGDGKGCRNNE